MRTLTAILAVIALSVIVLPAHAQTPRQRYDSLRRYGTTSPYYPQLYPPVMVVPPATIYQDPLYRQLEEDQQWQQLYLDQRFEEMEMLFNRQR